MAAYVAGRDSTVPDQGIKGDIADPCRSHLEQLADALELRDMRTTLAAGDDGHPVLEVTNPRAGSFKENPPRVRAWFRAGRFWWTRIDSAATDDDLARVTNEELARAVEGVAAALRWSPIDTSALCHIAPDDT